MARKANTAVVINDDAVQLRVTSAQIEQHGLKVLPFQSAEEALPEISGTAEIALIVTDLYMPGIDGWRLCRMLRSDAYREFNETPILVISATFSGADAEEITSALGANAFLPIPYKKPELYKCIDCLLAGERFSREIHVLIIDDDEIQTKILDEALSGRGYISHVAASASKGRELYRLYEPQVVVLDYYLPDATGDILLKEFSRPDSDSVVIMITASEDTEIALDLVRHGASAYIRKPFSPEYLVELFEKARREKSWLRADKILDERTRQLQESEGRYHRMVNAVTVYTYSVRLREGDTVSCEHSIGCKQVTGYDHEDADSIKNFWREISHPDCLQQIDRTISELYAGKDVQPIEHRIIHKDGSKRWVSHTFAPYRAQNGEVIYYDGIVEDITQRKLAEEALKHRVALEQLVSTISTRFIHFKAGEIDRGVNSALQVVGEFEEVDRCYIFKFSTDGTMLNNTHEWCREGISPQIDNLQNLPADTFPWWMKRLNNLECILIPRVADLPPQASAEKEILESQDIKSLLVVPMVGSGGLEGFIGFDAVNNEKAWDEGDISLLETLASIFANAFERQVNEEEKNALILKTTKRTKEIACLYGFSKILRNPNWSLEDTMQSAVELIPTGWQYPEAACARIVYEGQIFKTGNYRQTPWSMIADINIGGSWSGAVEVSYLDEKPAQDEGPFLKEERNLLDVLAREVSVSVELRQLAMQLQQSQKMEAIGLLAGGVAHDFNNLLTGIIGYSQLAFDGLTQDEPVRNDIEQIMRASETAAALTNQLLAFSRKQILNPKTINLNDTVKHMSKMLRRLIGENIELRTTLASELGNTKADPNQLQQVIMNLAVNARDAMPDGGKLFIETSNVNFVENFEAKHAGVKPGHYVMLAMSDTGAGMDERTRSHVFEPFFTTKEKGRGTGLGLSTVYGIIRQSDGNIWVYSEPGKGSTFKIYLPRIDSPVDKSAMTGPGDDIFRGTETILLVEDENLIREFSRRVLEKKGYTVLDASNGAEALLVNEKYDGAIHIVLTDVVMPGMSGAELAKRLQVFRPEIKVLYMSGYTDNAIVHHGILDSDKQFIQKPFTIDDLARKIREVLDQPSGQ